MVTIGLITANHAQSSRLFLRSLLDALLVGAGLTGPQSRSD
jgi:hypothetical protein